jgi:hypothetical protein
MGAPGFILCEEARTVSLKWIEERKCGFSSVDTSINDLGALGDSQTS